MFGTSTDLSIPAPHMPQGSDSLPVVPPRPVEFEQGGGMGTWSAGGGMVRRPVAPPEAAGDRGPGGGGRPISSLDETAYTAEKRPRLGQQAEEAGSKSSSWPLWDPGKHDHAFGR